MSASNQPDLQLIHAELARFAGEIPAIRAVCLFDMYGLGIDFYGKSERIDQDQILAMAADVVSLEARAAGGLRLGHNPYVISSGPRGTGLYFPVKESWFYYLAVIAEPGVSLDHLLSAVRASCETLQPLLEAFRYPDEQLIHAELVRLAEAIPAILALSVISEMGIGIAYHGKRDPLDEDRIAAYAINFISKGNLIAGRFKLWKRSYATIGVIGGSNGTGVYFPIGMPARFYLIVLVESGASLDSLIPAILPGCGTLQKIVYG